MLELLKSIILGIVEGITEWLPISSTGHMILVNEFLQLKMTDAFKEMFFVVIQLGAIMAVVVLYWKRLLPFGRKNKVFFLKRETLSLWGKILVACIPAAIIGLLFDDKIEELFYKPTPIAIALIVFGVLFIVIETYNKKRSPKIRTLKELDYKTVLIIGLFQVIAAVFPGTSRSGATIMGGILAGASRRVSAEFTFFLAIPVMFGASLLKLVKFGFAFTGFEFAVLLIGMVVAFIVSILAIKFLLGYIKKHDFKAFGWYRIVLGALVLLYFLVFKK